MSIPFTFPNYRENFEVVKNIEAIKTQLQRQCDAFTLWMCNYKVEQRSHGKYIYVKCKNCHSSLRYTWIQQEEIYQLKHFNNNHRHQYQENINHQLRRFIDQLPLSVQLATARKIATNKFKITASKFYHAYSRLKKSSSTLPELIKELERRDYQVNLDPFPLPSEQIPRIIVLISPEMKENFNKYGQVVCFDLTYNIIQEISPQKRQYAVGIFTGVNCYNKITPFGIAITCQETTESFCKIFETFILCCGQPKSFITDQQTSIISAITRLQDQQIFNGTHLIDSFHVIRNFSKISETKEYQKYISDLIKQENPTAFELKLKQLQQQLTTEKELRAFQLFNNKKHQVCFSQIPRKSFLIFNSSNSINQKMNDLIKSRIRSQKKYSQVLRILIEFCETLIITSKIQQIFQDPELRLCRYLLAKRPMKEFLQQYVLSLSLKQPHREGQRFIFEEQFNTFECEYTDHFDCSCSFTSKTGIGCRHMLWICRKQKLDYMETIHQRWKFFKKQGIKIIKRSNRSTRRRK